MAYMPLKSLIKYNAPQPIARLAVQRPPESSKQASATRIKVPEKVKVRELLTRICEDTNIRFLQYEILSAAVPPWEFQDTKGRCWRQTVSQEPSDREDVIELEMKLNEMLYENRARFSGLCPIRRKVFGQVFDELIRQVTIVSEERGLVLLRLREEIEMTYEALVTLFWHGMSRQFGLEWHAELGDEQDPGHQIHRKAPKAQIMADLSDKVAVSLNVRNEVKETRDKLLYNYNVMVQKNQEEMEAIQRKHKEEYHFLKRVHATLKHQIEQIAAVTGVQNPLKQVHEEVVLVSKSSVANKARDDDDDEDED